MGLNFPNVSRSFLPSRRAVQFWGYDEALEISFFVTEEALRHIQPGTNSDENDMLRAFDANLTAVHKVAARAYRRGGTGSYELTSKSF